jgi:hypothetical protein
VAEVLGSRGCLRIGARSAVGHPPGRVHEPPPHDDGPLPAIAGVSYVSRIDPDFTRVAQEAAGKGEVRCWSSTAWPERAFEFVRFNHVRIAHGQTAESVIPAYLSSGRKRINISGEVCNGLGRFLAGGPVDGEAAYGARVVGQMTGI